MKVQPINMKVLDNDKILCMYLVIIEERNVARCFFRSGPVRQTGNYERRIMPREASLKYNYKSHFKQIKLLHKALEMVIDTLSQGFPYILELEVYTDLEFQIFGKKKLSQGRY